MFPPRPGTGPRPLRIRRAVRPSVFEFEPRRLLSGAGSDVLTSHNDNARTGQDLAETTLTPGNVNTSSFGKLFGDAVDGSIYAQPLVMSGLTIPGQGSHDVVFVATEHDSVYAFDADNPGKPLWQASFIDPAAGITTVPTPAIYQKDLNPEVGITGTPVIDAATGTLYVVAETQYTTAAGTLDILGLHALDVTTGAEKFGGPITIAATVRGKGIGHLRNGLVPFQSDFEIQRPGLLLDDGVVYASFGSLGDHGPYHGWVIGYSAASLQEVAVFNDTPNSTDRTGNYGGIWMSGGGPAADAAGNIYLLVGSGQYNPSQGSFGDTALKLSPSLRVIDDFAPAGTARLDTLDLDLGSGGVLLAPSRPGATPDTLIGGGKVGTLEVINTAALGGYRRIKGITVEGIVNPAHPIFSSAAYFNGDVYIQAVGDVLREYAMIDGKLAGPVALSSTTFGYPGATPSISADGTADGIVWEIQYAGSGKFPGPAILHAYNAANIAQELYNSTQAGGRDTLGLAVKFAVPSVANGRVYVGTQAGLAVFGELPG